MDKAILVDTDVMVDYLRGRDAAVALVKGHADRILLSAIVVAELYAGVKGEQEQGVLDELLSVLQVVPVGAGTARAAGLFKRDFGTSHGIGLADAIMAATARSENAGLSTLNVKHYPMFKGLRPAYLKK